MDIALAIRIGMARRDIKATELANRANINGSTLSLILNKKRSPTLTTLESLSKGLDMKVSELIKLGEIDDKWRDKQTEEGK